jgi:hypothetical protein
MPSEYRIGNVPVAFLGLNLLPIRKNASKDLLKVFPGIEVDGFHWSMSPKLRRTVNVRGRAISAEIISYATQAGKKEARM